MENSNILLYGASNLWLSRRAALSQLRSRFSGHLRIGMANGPGRSYGLRAGNPLVRYQPLCSVRFDFEQIAATHRLAVITDVGNDIAYAQAPQRVLEWVARLTADLESQGYRIIVGGVPRRSLERIHPGLFRAIAKLYYPQGSISKEHVIEQLSEVEGGLATLCRERGYRHPPVNSDWYSLDRFHLKLSSTDAYWHSLLEDYPLLSGGAAPSFRQALRPLFPDRYWLCGKERRGEGIYRDMVANALIWVK